MKKFIIIQVSVDSPSMDDDGIDAGLGFGLASRKGYDTLEEAKAEQKAIAEDTLADLSECYGIGEEDCETSVEGEIEDYSDTNGDVEVVFWDHGYELNRTIFRIQEVEF